MKFGSLSITTTDGRTRDYPIDLPSLVVGRADSNSIVIDDLTVARRHARLLIDSGHLLVEDLGSATGTFIDGQRIPTHSASLVDDGQEIRFGEVRVHYTEAAMAAEQPAAGPSPAVEAAVIPARLTEMPASIRATLTLPGDPIEPGAGAAVGTLLLQNRGRIVDELAIVVNDLPVTWVKLSVSRAVLLPGEEIEVGISIEPPRQAESLAGSYDFTIAVTSGETGREVITNGQIVVRPFEATSLTLQPVRSKKHFKLIARNGGNALATYALEGSDDEAAFQYEFEAPTVQLPAGRESTLPFRVSPKKRKLFGPATAQPFAVVASPTSGTGEKASVRGQLAIAPPLEPLKRPAMFSLLLILVGLGALVFFFLPSDNHVKATGTEEAYAGVHMCDKSADQAKVTQPPPTKAQLPKGSTTSGAPYFAQNDPQWANEEYAKAKDPQFGPDWCGTTIEQCGCAMTSVTTVMALFNILTMPDGSDLTPKTVNDWFNQNARKTSRGWVSQGYIYGDVIWTAANQLSGEIAQVRPQSRTIRFARTGSGSDEEIRSELKAGRPIVLEVPGHWIAAVGLDGDKIMINDPFYRDRKTLDVYAGKVKSSVLFEPSDDLSAVVITVPADERVRVTDKQGRVVGSLNTGTMEEAAAAAKEEIPGASYSARQAWRDPTCVESPPPPGSGTNQIVLPGSRDDYKIEVLDTSGGATSVSIHTYDKQGVPSLRTIDADGGLVASVNYDPTKVAPDIKVLDEQPLSEDSSARSAGKNPSPSPSLTATATASPTATPTQSPAAPAGPVTTILSQSVAPGAKIVSIGSNQGFAVGDIIRFSPGAANEEDNTIVGFGSFILAAPLKFAHSAGEPIVRIAGVPGGAPPPPVSNPGLAPPASVKLSCTPIYSANPRRATLICTMEIDGTYTTTRWAIDGRVQSQFTGQTVMLVVFSDDSTVAVAATACNVTVCASDSATQAIRFPLTAGANQSLSPPSTPPPAPTPVVVAPTGAVVPACTVTFDAGLVAHVTCKPVTDLAYSTITWKASGGLTLDPATGRPLPDGSAITGFANPEDLTVDESGNANVVVQATLCPPATTEGVDCIPSTPANVTIPYATTTLSLLPAAAPLDTNVSFFAVISGPLAPTEGTVTFYDVTDVNDMTDQADFQAHAKAIGLDVKITPIQNFAFAQLNFHVGTSPLDSVGDRNIVAFYKGSTNMFGGPSAPVQMTIRDKIPDICNSIDDNGNGTIDGATEGCQLPIQNGAINTTDSVQIGSKDIGGGTRLSGITTTLPYNADSNQYNATPGQSFTLTAAANMASAPAGTDPYCKDCKRQVYIGIGENVAAVARVPATGPVCALNESLAAFTDTGKTLNPIPLLAPTTPGMYYIRATSSVQTACGQPEVGGPDASIVRIIVRADTKTTMLPAPETQLSQHVTLKAKVETQTPNLPGAITGLVAFCDESITVSTPAGICDDKAPLGTATVQTVRPTGQPVSYEAWLDFDTTELYTNWPSTTSVVATHQIRAYLLDDASIGAANPYYNASKSGNTEDLLITPATTTTKVVLGSNPVMLGDTVTLNAVVRSGPFGDFGGQVEFFDGSRSLGKADVSGNEIGIGVFSLDTSDLYIPNPGTGDLPPVGDHNIRAKYIHDGNYGDSDNAQPTSRLTVNAAPSILTLTLDTNSVALGDPVVITASMDDGSTNGHRFGNFAGTVEFKRDGVQPGTSVALSGNKATLTFDTSTLSGIGTEHFSATFVPASPSNYAASQDDSPPLTVGPTATTVTLTRTGSGGSVALGAEVDGLTATVKVANGESFGAIGGTVEFRVGDFVLGSGAVGGSGVATCSTSTCDTGNLYDAVANPSPTGSQEIKAYYLGATGGNYADSGESPAVVVTVDKAATTLTLGTLSSPVTLGEPTILKASLTADGGAPPFGLAGDVKFMEETTELATGTIGSDGTVQVSFDTGNFYTGGTTPVTGPHNITVTYAGAGNYAAATTPSSKTITVDPAPLPVVAISASGTSTVKFTVQVASGAFGPINNTFTITQVPSGIPPLSAVLADGIGTVSSSSLPAGTSTYIATVDAGGNYGGGTSLNTAEVTVLKPTITSFSAPSTSVYANQATTLSATVSCPSCSNGTNIGGSLQFIDADSGIPLLATAATVSNNGNTSASYTFATSGNYHVIARYLGSGTMAPSDSPIVTISVALSPTTVALSISPTSVAVGGTVTFTATVTFAGGSVTSTATVHFKDGGQELASGSVGAAGRAVGTYTAKTGDSGKTITIVAVFDGDSTYGASTSGSQTFSVS